ncbi:hypothetical protein NRB20_63220 [Nocardia sp. RB20]|uniref:Uncharacterized protein n=1 Tax=Nocardia macrotermitis TaxID=2585198 RepID=A0A7K0DBM9_9NOCA|nr:hypothetical protein [Nocardia macrotermitis]
MTPRAWQRLLRTVTTLVALDSFAQAMFAGRLMAGSYDGLDAHSLNGSIMAIGMLIMTLCFAAAWRFGQATGRAVLRSAALTVAAGAEIGLGHKAILAVHVPLGVALVAGLVAVTMQVWAKPAIETEVAA